MFKLLNQIQHYIFTFIASFPLVFYFLKLTSPLEVFGYRLNAFGAILPRRVLYISHTHLEVKGSGIEGVLTILSHFVLVTRFLGLLRLAGLVEHTICW